MKTIFFITGNKRKLATAQEAMKEFGFELQSFEYDIPEIQAQTVKEVSEYFVKEVSNRINNPIVKVDVGFNIDALNGFPGPYSKYINQWLSSEKILKMMEDTVNRKAKFISVLSYCEPQSSPVSFISEINGTISNESIGENGWGLDRIFIPAQFKTTLANLTDTERKNVWNKNNWIELARCLLDKQK